MRLKSSQPTASGTRSDGRRARSERSRLAIANAMLELIAAGNTDPSAKQVADQAGVSVRLVFHQFKNMASIYKAMLLMQTKRLGHLIDPDVIPSDAPFDERLAEFTEQRATLLEFITPSRKVITGRGLYRAADVAEGLALWTDREMEQVKKVFAPELSRYKGEHLSERLAAIQTATSWTAWYSLRDHQELPPGKAQSVMSCTVRSLLTG